MHLAHQTRKKTTKAPPFGWSSLADPWLLPALIPLELEVPIKEHSGELGKGCISNTGFFGLSKLLVENATGLICGQQACSAGRESKRMVLSAKERRER